MRNPIPPRLVPAILLTALTMMFNVGCTGGPGAARGSRAGLRAGSLGGRAGGFNSAASRNGGRSVSSRRLNQPYRANFGPRSSSTSGYTKRAVAGAPSSPGDLAEGQAGSPDSEPGGTTINIRELNIGVDRSPGQYSRSVQSPVPSVAPRDEAPTPDDAGKSPAPRSPFQTEPERMLNPPWRGRDPTHQPAPTIPAAAYNV